MPSVSSKQHRYFGMASTPEGRAKLKAEGKNLPPVSVAKDFLRADKGRKFGKARKK